MSEFEFIKRIRERAYRPADDVKQGIGDDCAIISCGSGGGDKDLLISCDLLVEDIHFRLDYTSAQSLGHKALAVSLSDIAAMGGRPRFCTVSVAAPRKLSGSFLDEFYTGLLRLADEYEVILIGGDTSTAPDRLVIDLTIIGECTAGWAVRRSRAQSGDLIYVTGELGASAAGLKLLQRGYQPVLRNPNEIEQLMNQAVSAHLEPAPRVAFGRILATMELATAMIDLSDGLSSDLNHICAESSVGAAIRAELLPISPSVETVRGASLDLALNGGEDYELLFTINPANQGRMEEELSGVLPPVTCIGEIRPGSEVTIYNDGAIRPLRPKGYDHFK